MKEPSPLRFPSKLVVSGAESSEEIILIKVSERSVGTIPIKIPKQSEGIIPILNLDS